MRLSVQVGHRCVFPQHVDEHAAEEEDFLLCATAGAQVHRFVVMFRFNLQHAEYGMEQIILAHRIATVFAQAILVDPKAAGEALRQPHDHRNLCLLFRCD